MVSCNSVNTLFATGMNLEDTTPGNITTDTKRTSYYKSIISCHMNAMVATSPDLVYTVLVLSKYSLNPLKAHFDATKYTLHNLK